MRIAVHSSHYPYTTHRSGYVSGGGERVAQAVAEGLANRDHEVIVYTAAVEAASKTIENGVEVNRSRSIARLGKTSVSPGQFVPVSEPVDIVHVHNTTPPGVLSGLFHAITVGAPLVLTHHGNDRYVPDGSFVKRAFDYLYTEHLLDRILQYSNAITLPSKAYLSESERLSRVRNKVVEIPNGIDVDRYDQPSTAADAETAFDLPTNAPVVVFVGDLIRKKGPDLLIRAAPMLDDDTTVVVAGSGPLQEELQEQAPDSVLLPGFISEKHKIALLNRADLFCLPSRTHTEVFPLVLLEAYASRTPVVVSDLGTFDGIVTGETGQRFPRDNWRELGTSIRQLLSDPEFRETLASGAYAQAKQYRWENITEQYESLFCRIVDSRF